MSNVFRLETYSGQPASFAGGRLIPFHQALRLDLRLPFKGGGWQGGLVWNRPTAVWVQDAQAGEQVLPVKDMTRRWVFAIWGGVLAWLALRWLLQGVKP